MANVPLSLDHFYALKTEQGWSLGNFCSINGHHLVYKIPVADTTELGIALPEYYRKKATKNVVMIRGFVICASLPWHRKYTHKRMVWDIKTESWKTVWRVWDSAIPQPSDFGSGIGVLYNSYNVGKVKVPGLPEPLVVVRDIDVEATFSIDSTSRIHLGAKCMDKFQDRYRTHVQI